MILIKEEEWKIITDILEKSNEEAIRQNEDYFDLIIDMETWKHRYIDVDNNHRESLRRKLNRFESFWGNAKSRLSKFKGMHSTTGN